MINRFKNDKWLFVISNLPTEDSMANLTTYFDNYIRSVTLPDYNMEMMNIDGPFGFQTRTPMGPKKNQNLSQLQVTYKLSEDFMNYLIIFKWMNEMKYGQPSKIKDGQLFRYYSINKALLQMLDHQKRKIAEIEFTHLIPTSLGSLPLAMGSSEEVDFTVNFTYEEVTYRTFDIMDGTINPTAPSLIDPCGITTPLETSGTWQQN